MDGFRSGRRRGKKKLKDAAAEWVRSWGQSGPVEIGRDFEGPAWMHEELEDGGADRQFGVLPQNWQAAQTFFSCTTQWRSDPDGSLLGLDYSGLQVVLRHQRAPRGTFELVQIMEQEAVRESRERSRRK